MIINKLKFETYTFESVARDTHLSRQNIIDIFDRYIDYKPNKLPEILSFDEKHINNSLTSNAYIFIIFDFKEIKEVISNTDEEKIVENKKMSKKDKELIAENIEREMKEAAKNLDFERAMELRDILFELKSQ